MTTLTGWTQMINAVILATIVLMALVVGHRWPEARAALVPPSLWAVFGVIFYLCLFGGYLSPTEVLLWGAIHRMLAALLVLGGVITLWAILRDEPPDYHYGDYPDDGRE
jgi:hypothetical protein